MEEKVETLRDWLGFPTDDVPAQETFTRGYLHGWNASMSLVYWLSLKGASSFEAYYTALFYWSALHDWINKGLCLLDIARNFFTKRPYKGIQGKKGYVYVIRADNGLCKIGQTIELNNRIKQLAIQLPYELELIHAVGTDHVTNAERLLHDRYSGKRRKGEWFTLTDEDLKEIKALDYLHAASGEKVALWFAGWKKESCGDE